MQYIIVLTIVFVIMLLAPFAGAMIYCAGKKVSILKIHQGKVKDARYFGKSFAELVEKNFSSMGEDVIKLSQEEEFMDGDEELKFPEEVEKLVICQDKSFYSPKKVKVYHKEIYTGQNIAIVAAILLRIFITGALHEDGLTDFVDGFGGGGSDRQRILEINLELLAACKLLLVVRSNLNDTITLCNLHHIGTDKLHTVTCTTPIEAVGLTVHITSNKSVVVEALNNAQVCTVYIYRIVHHTLVQSVD